MAENLVIFKKGEETPAFTGDATSAAITGLAPNTAVAAGDYQGAFSDGTNTSDKVDVPAFKVKDVALTAPTVTLTAGDAKLDYTIKLGAANGGSAATALKLSYSSDGSKWTDVAIADPTKLTGTVDGLTNDTEYQVKVITTNAAGDSPASAIVKATPVAAAEG
ncbi:fibronectin type III domain-containing protein [Lacticaseibacillus absianus]|uniref:fibronectin type III domain-containing protein n=1 Tax=Lacticaseibacillus absianus TaxID=2729623 RepID=UPI0015C9796E|nr:fibronectin type III domain-containing protein [Lacticaseibacillus absianus]